MVVAPSGVLNSRYFSLLPARHLHPSPTQESASAYTPTASIVHIKKQECFFVSISVRSKASPSLGICLHARQIYPYPSIECHMSFCEVYRALSSGRSLHRQFQITWVFLFKQRPRFEVPELAMRNHPETWEELKESSSSRPEG